MDDEGVGEVVLPDAPENSIGRHVRFERLNSDVVEVYTTHIIWDQEDETDLILAAIDGEYADFDEEFDDVDPV